MPPAARPKRAALRLVVRGKEKHMPKVDKGRMDGVDGMSKYSALELYALADEYDARITSPDNTDDPKWLKRRADRLRRLASQKEKALIHKIGPIIKSLRKNRHDS